MENNSNSSPIVESLAQRYAAASALMQQAIASVETVYVGQPEVVKLSFACLIAGGHLSLEGPPSVGKTTLANAMADVLGMSFRRIQGTPDLTPGDITGSVVRNTVTGEFEIKEGPIFSNIILFDEINRTGPKVQSALLEAMQEKQVTLNGETRKLPKPFFVMSTQNPFDNEGVYPLTEAGKDRFMMRVDVTYPSEDIEHKIATKPNKEQRLAPILNVEKVSAIQGLIDEVSLGDDFSRVCVQIVRKFRPKSEGSPQHIIDNVEREASLRASTAFVRAAKTLALIEGRAHPDMSDIKRIAPAILRHRVTMRNPYDDKIFDQTVAKVLLEFGIK